MLSVVIFRMALTAGLNEPKQAIILRTDLKMGRGKLVAQGAHASIEAYLDALSKTPEVALQWRKEGMKKIALKVGSEAELVKLFQIAKEYKLPCSLIADAGHTQVEPGSKTAVGIGPAKAEIIDRICGQLKLL